ncbi:MAG: TolC family protein [Bacteroidaceae bacterium]|nr:TolC family protein [Bacteroidaceae bacterium]
MKSFLTTLFALFAVTAANAQSLEECRRLAREHYPETRQYDLIAETEQYNLSNAARAWIPQVALSGQATYQTATPAYPDAFKSILAANGMDMNGIRKDQYKVAIDVSQNIWDGGLYSANRAISKAEAAEQRNRLEVSLYELQSRVDNLYFGILLLDERKEQTEAMINLLESNLNRLRSLYSNGVATQSDADAVEAELLTAQQTLVQVETSRASYVNMLEILIGKELESERLEWPAMPEVASRNSARPELAMFDAQERKVEAQRKAVKSAVMPRFSAFAQGYYGYPGLDMFKSMVSSEWTLNAIVGVRMQWNIGAFYTQKNNLEKLNAAKRQIALQRDVFMFNTGLQTAQEDGEIARLRKAIENDDRIVELRSSVRKAAESKLDNGVIDATELLQKITDETTAMLNRSRHRVELLQAIYKLKTTLNQ